MNLVCQNLSTWNVLDRSGKDKAVLWEMEGGLEMLSRLILVVCRSSVLVLHKMLLIPALMYDSDMEREV